MIKIDEFQRVILAQAFDAIIANENREIKNWLAENERLRHQEHQLIDEENENGC